MTEPSPQPKRPSNESNEAVTEMLPGQVEDYNNTNNHHQNQNNNNINPQNFRNSRDKVLALLKKQEDDKNNNNQQQQSHQHSLETQQPQQQSTSGFRSSRDKVLSLLHNRQSDNSNDDNHNNQNNFRDIQFVDVDHPQHQEIQNQNRTSNVVLVEQQQQQQQQQQQHHPTPLDLDKLADSRIPVPFVCSPDDQPPPVPTGISPDPWSFGDNLIVNFVTWNMAGMEKIPPKDGDPHGHIYELITPTGHLIVYASQENGPYVGTNAAHESWEKLLLDGLNKRAKEEFVREIKQEQEQQAFLMQQQQQRKQQLQRKASKSYQGDVDIFDQDYPHPHHHGAGSLPGDDVNVNGNDNDEGDNGDSGEDVHQYDLTNRGTAEGSVNNLAQLSGMGIMLPPSQHDSTSVGPTMQFTASSRNNNNNSFGAAAASATPEGKRWQKSLNSNNMAQQQQQQQTPSFRVSEDPSGNPPSTSAANNINTNHLGASCDLTFTPREGGTEGSGIMDRRGSVHNPKTFLVPLPQVAFDGTNDPEIDAVGLNMVSHNNNVKNLLPRSTNNNGSGNKLAVSQQQQQRSTLNSSNNVNPLEGTTPGRPSTILSADNSNAVENAIANVNRSASNNNNNNNKEEALFFSASSKPGAADGGLVALAAAHEENDDDEEEKHNNNNNSHQGGPAPSRPPNVIMGTLNSTALFGTSVNNNNNNQVGIIIQNSTTNSSSDRQQHSSVGSGGGQHGGGGGGPSSPIIFSTTAPNNSFPSGASSSLKLNPGQRSNNNIRGRLERKNTMITAPQLQQQQQSFRRNSGGVDDGGLQQDGQHQKGNSNNIDDEKSILSNEKYKQQLFLRSYSKVQAVSMWACNIIVFARNDVKDHISRVNFSIVKTGGLGGALGNKGGLCVEFSIDFPKPSAESVTALLKDPNFVFGYHSNNNRARQLQQQKKRGPNFVPAPTVVDGIQIRKTAEEKPVRGVSFAFVCAHLAPHEHAVKERNDNVSTILQKLEVGSEGPHSEEARRAPIGIQERLASDEFDFFMFGGDLNYRIDGQKEAIEKIIHQHGNLRAVLSNNDQLLKQLRTSKQLASTFRGFREGPLTFRPTYKYEIEGGKKDEKKKQKAKQDGNTNNQLPSPLSSEMSGYDRGPKNRLPSYTDRVLYRRHFTYRYPMHLLYYYDVRSVCLSDHKPVMAIVALGTPFDAEVKRHIQEGKLDGVYFDNYGGPTSCCDCC